MINNIIAYLKNGLTERAASLIVGLMAYEIPEFVERAEQEGLTDIVEGLPAWVWGRLKQRGCYE
jgi:hypothetical protein